MKSQIDRNNVWGRDRGGGVVFKNAIFIAFSSVSRQFLSVSRQIKIKTEGEMSELTSRQILAALMVKTKPGHTKSGIWSSSHKSMNHRHFDRWKWRDFPNFFAIILNVFPREIVVGGWTKSADKGM